MTEYILAEMERLEALAADLKRRQRRNFRVSIGVLVVNLIVFAISVCAYLR